MCWVLICAAPTLGASGGSARVGQGGLPPYERSASQCASHSFLPWTGFIVWRWRLSYWWAPAARRQVVPLQVARTLTLNRHRPGMHSTRSLWAAISREGPLWPTPKQVFPLAARWRCHAPVPAESRSASRREPSRRRRAMRLERSSPTRHCRARSCRSRFARQARRRTT